jgi:hypothetical protein
MVTLAMGARSTSAELATGQKPVGEAALLPAPVTPMPESNTPLTRIESVLPLV